MDRWRRQLQYYYFNTLIRNIVALAVLNRLVWIYPTLVTLFIYCVGINIYCKTIFSPRLHRPLKLIGRLLACTTDLALGKGIASFRPQDVVSDFALTRAAPWAVYLCPRRHPVPICLMLDLRSVLPRLPM